MSGKSCLSLVAVALLVIAPATLHAQKAPRPLDTRGALTTDVESGLAGGNRRNEPRRVTFGAAHRSSLDNSDRAFNDGRIFEYWEMELEAGDQATVTLRSTAFDSYLGAFNTETPAAVIENDDFEAISTDARITIRASANGVYGIYVTSYEPRERGAYTLDVVRTKSGGPLDVNFAATTEVTSGFAGGSVPELPRAHYDTRNWGSLRASDPTLPGGQYIDAWRVNIGYNSTVWITVRSNEFDTVVALFNPETKSVELENDDFEPNSTDSQLRIRTRTGGEYYIYVSSFEPGKTGMYTVTVQLMANP